MISNCLRKLNAFGAFLVAVLARLMPARMIDNMKLLKRDRDAVATTPPCTDSWRAVLDSY